MERGRFEPSGAAARMVALASVALLVLVAWAGAPRAAAAVGLDPSFGKGGLAVTSDSDSYEGVELGIAPDGSSLLSSSGKAVRLDADGLQDLGFGEGGEASFEALAAGLTSETLKFTPRGTALDSQGRTLVYGELVDSSRSVEEGYSGSVDASSAVVIRLDAEGRLDPTFGEGKGYVISTFGIRTRLPGVELPTVGIMAGTVDSADRPVLIAGVQDGVSGCYARGSIELNPAAVVRLTDSGMSDPSFGGGDGVAPIGGSGVVSDPVLALDAGGGPVAAVGRRGNYDGECGAGRLVYRLRADGSRAGSFGRKGLRDFTRLELAFVEPSGELILSRRHGSYLRIARVDSHGRRDTTFGHGGIARLQLSSAVNREFAPVGVDAQGRILLAGIGSTVKRGLTDLSGDQIVLGRLLSDGELDPSFGRKGLLRTRLPKPEKITAIQAALDPQGRLLVGATVSEPDATPTQPDGTTSAFLLARYLLE
jgi:uncharacterized delta-60 repeat protein